MAYINLSAASTAPAVDAAAVTPADATDLPLVPARGLYIGTTGDVKVTTANGSTVVFTAVTGVLPLQVSRVWSTLTTASDIIALY